MFGFTENYLDVFLFFKFISTWYELVWVCTVMGIRLELTTSTECNKLVNLIIYREVERSS